MTDVSQNAGRDGEKTALRILKEAHLHINTHIKGSLCNMRNKMLLADRSNSTIKKLTALWFSK